MRLLLKRFSVLVRILRLETELVLGYCFLFSYISIVRDRCFWVVRYFSGGVNVHWRSLEWTLVIRVERQLGRACHSFVRWRSQAWRSNLWRHLANNDNHRRNCTGARLRRAGGRRRCAASPPRCTQKHTGVTSVAPINMLIMPCSLMQAYPWEGLQGSGPLRNLVKKSATVSIRTPGSCQKQMVF